MAFEIDAPPVAEDAIREQVDEVFSYSQWRVLRVSGSVAVRGIVDAELNDYWHDCALNDYMQRSDRWGGMSYIDRDDPSLQRPVPGMDVRNLTLDSLNDLLPGFQVLAAAVSKRINYFATVDELPAEHGFLLGEIIKTDSMWPKIDWHADEDLATNYAIGNYCIAGSAKWRIGDFTRTQKPTDIVLLGTDERGQSITHSLRRGFRNRSRKLAVRLSGLDDFDDSM